MSTRGSGDVTCLVLAAGSSRRLGRPKQLLPFRGGTLLGATLDRARAVGAAQVLVTLGGWADEVGDRVDLRGCQPVRVVDHTSGCSSSIVAALGHVAPTSDGIVLLLGDQPGVDPAVVTTLVAAARGHDLGVCRYADGLGHPLWLGRGIFPDLAGLHGDKGVWRLVDHHHDVVEVPVAGDVPLDVDTEQEYRTLLGSEAGDG